MSSALLAISPNIHSMFCLLCPLILKSKIKVFFFSLFANFLLVQNLFLYSCTQTHPCISSLCFDVLFLCFSQILLLVKPKKLSRKRAECLEKIILAQQKKGGLSWYFWFLYQYYFFFHSQFYSINELHSVN